jgi:glycosyl hydrolase family 123
MRRVGGILAAVAVVLALSAGSGAAHTTDVTVGVYPSGTAFTTNGGAPAHAAAAVSLAMPIGGVDDAIVLVRGAQDVALRNTSIDSPLQLNFLRAHFVSVSGTLIPDVLESWNGTQHATEQTNQPIWLQVTVPDGTTPGTYNGSVDVVADGTPTTIPITVTVYNVTLPAPSDTSSKSLLTAFNVSPQSYGAEVHDLFGIDSHTVVTSDIPGLFSFLSSYRISPNNWGYGNPDSKSGYTSSAKYWKDRPTRMTDAVGDPRQFGAMWIPISNNRATRHEWVAGLSPNEPGTWCSYLRAVHKFWDDHGWLDGSFPYLYGMDEPGTKGFPIVAQQDKAVHSCFPGSHAVMTGLPSSRDKKLWDGGKDDLDVFVPLESRYYGLRAKHGKSRATIYLKGIKKARKKGKRIWTYTYESNSNDTPGFALNEPPADPRMATAWAALEGITGILRGQGTTSYSGSADPRNVNDKSFGDFVLIYPGRDAPVPSARLEVFREGIEDWEILNVVRKQHGSSAVVGLLSDLFSTTRTGAKLACTSGCPIKITQQYSWPLWSKDATTPAKLAAMRAAALQAATS